MFSRSLITPITAALFLLIAVSGVALFFHINSGWFRELHEWAGMAFVVVALGHAFLNRKALFSYMKKPVPLVVMAMVLVAGLIVAMVADHSHKSRGQRALDKAGEVSSSIFWD